jgi:starch phosphorylase
MHDGDEYFLLADFESYTATQRQAGETFKDQPSWTRKAILNVARLGKFSSDRAIAEYADEIWHIKAVK